MAILRFENEWSTKKTITSICLFFVHFIVLLAIMAVLLLGSQLNNFVEHMRQFGASYLYALFCVMLLVLITYMYFFFEDKRILSTGKNIAMIFMVLDLSFIISWLIGAKIDIFGVGERLITAKSDPVFGGVYKLTAVEKDGKIIPKIKISENSAKIINPGHKKIVRFYDNVSGKALADLLCLAHEEIDTSNDYTIFDPVETWKTKTIYDYHIKELQVPIYKDGKLVYDRPTLEEIGKHCDKSKGEFFPEYRRVVNTQEYKVDLSENMWNLKHKLLGSRH